MTKVFGVESVMCVNAVSLHIRADNTSTSGTFNDLTMDMIMENNNMKSKILFLKHILQHNSLLKEIFLHEFEENKPSKWMKQVNKYMLDLQFTLYTIEYSKPQYIRKL